jgi:NAD(P)-dependent dehydrogenase (short-subunit alcohol dehydrogenase family)
MVTGAAGGIGSATARTLVELGWGNGTAVTSLSAPVASVS